MLELYRRRVSSQGKYVGEALKKQSDTIMEQTFSHDIAYRICYINNEPIEAKYITHTYYSISKDAVDYHLQFKPGIHYPIGTYVDVPDDTETYNRWLIVGRSDEPQFVKYNILKCNWTFKWIKDGVIKECLGVLRKRNSYNSGLWTDFYTTSPENQTQFILPTTPLTQEITYNMRFLISDNQINPIAWEVSKIEDTSPKGITYVTLKQDFFNPNRDNKELMIADYYKSNIEPEENTSDILDVTHMKIKYSSSATVKVGGSYKIFSIFSDCSSIDHNKVLWTIDGLDESEYNSILSEDKIKIKVAKEYRLIGKVFTLKLFYDNKLMDAIEVEVISL